VTLFWFRRDLRLDDNAGLYHALKNSGHPVLPVFIFDRHILDELPNRRDARVTFIHQTINELHRQLGGLGSSLVVRFGTPEEVWPQLLAEYPVRAVYTNHDYEPYARQRDAAVAQLCAEKGVAWRTFKDHLIFEYTEVLKDDGTPYTVFTPYSRKWRARLDTRLMRQPDGSQDSYFLTSYPTAQYFDRLAQSAPLPVPTLEAMGFEGSAKTFPSASVTRGLVKNYAQTRDFPAILGTSRLGLHFRFGTISIREKARHARSLSDTYLSELIWRDFYAQILAHFPHVAGRAFKPQYDRIPWRNAPDDLARWQQGQTGYPIVDAGMRELNTTGFMHNRVRMVVASFLTKHLLLDWRLGEAYFAEKLLDFDLASNNGGWQWAAGCGTDAAPYFRVFNPTEQTKKFDPEYKYIRQWVPEFGTPRYPQPMVDHAFARARCLEVYKGALGGVE
jgi:deoxyribodipyrimidine photo-lyase